jgi:hypothetical protein
MGQELLHHINNIKHLSKEEEFFFSTFLANLEWRKEG